MSVSYYLHIFDKAVGSSNNVLNGAQKYSSSFIFQSVVIRSSNFQLYRRIYTLTKLHIFTHIQIFIQNMYIRNDNTKFKTYLIERQTEFKNFWKNKIKLPKIFPETFISSPQQRTDANKLGPAELKRARQLRFCEVIQQFKQEYISDNLRYLYLKKSSHF